MDADTRASLATVRRKADALQRLIAQFYELSQARNEDAPLACEPVVELLDAVSEPLTFERFVKNVTLAPSLTFLRIPVDPAEAVQKLC